MTLLRNLILLGADSAWLRRQAPQYPFVRRTVTRFMPGERSEDALAAAEALSAQGITAIATHLGENLSTEAEADQVAQHYLGLLDDIRRRGLDAQVSVKLTQLGLDLDTEGCLRRTTTLVERAQEIGNFIWIDMESSMYTDATLDVFQRLRKKYANVGVCLQAYLRRTVGDLNRLLPLSPAIRLVKGAYREPAELAFPDKKDVDENFFRLATRLMDPEDETISTFAGIATHDGQIIRRVQEFARINALPEARYEFEMLYGIQRAEQLRLAREGYRVRVLISYGDFWFPWFMRRLAERPGNLLFIVRNLFSR